MVVMEKRMSHAELFRVVVGEIDDLKDDGVLNNPKNHLRRPICVFA